METIRQSLGSREYEVVFRVDDATSEPDLSSIESTPANRPLLEERDGNHVVRTADVEQVAALLREITSHNWALVNLAVRESALEEIYVKLMTD